MGLWLLAYVGLGQVVVPLGLGLAGVEYEELGFRATALLHLAMDAVQLGVTLGILARCLGKYGPRRLGLFPLRWAGGRWLGWVAAGAATFPLVEWLSAQSWGLWSGAAGAAADGYGAHVWCAQLEASLGGGDWVTGAAYLAVVSVCAPLWEEAVFRGFLLASLARQLGARWATLVSALLFALCHFRADTFAPLLVLGLVFGGVFLRSNNLAPSIVCHSFWNMFVLWSLYARGGM
jgi:membrane protease YdiL (CAAX protease family)